MQINNDENWEMTSIRLYVVVFLTAKMVLFCVVDGILYSINLNEFNIH